MTCPKCKGDGDVLKTLPFKTYRSEQDWAYALVQCTWCKGKGYLTPEESGLGKM